MHKIRQVGPIFRILSILAVMGPQKGFYIRFSGMCRDSTCHQHSKLAYCRFGGENIELFFGSANRDST